MRSGRAAAWRLCKRGAASSSSIFIPSKALAAANTASSLGSGLTVVPRSWPACTHSLSGHSATQPALPDVLVHGTLMATAFVYRVLPVHNTKPLGRIGSDERTLGRGRHH